MWLLVNRIEPRNASWLWAAKEVCSVALLECNGICSSSRLLCAVLPCKAATLPIGRPEDRAQIAVEGFTDCLNRAEPGTF